MALKRLSTAFLAGLTLFSAMAAGPLHAGIPGPKWLSGLPLRTGNSVLLMWTPIPGATSYRLFRKSGDAPFREIYMGPANSYNDTSAPSNETITYKVSGIVKDVESEASAPGTIRKVEQLQPPSFIGAIGSGKFITLRWSSPPGTVFSNIYRSESEKGEYDLQESAQSDTFTDKKVQSGKKYYYRISSVGKEGKESPRSAPITAGTRDSGTGDAVVEKTIVLRLEDKGGFRGEELYEINQPAYPGLVGSDEELYVQERRGIQFFDHDGNYKNRIVFDKSWGLAGGMAQDRDGTFLVPFFGERLLRRIDRAGKQLSILRYPEYVDNNSRMEAPSRVNGGDANADTVSRLVTKFPNNPNQVAIDGSGNYWVIDGIRAQVIKFNGNGDELAVIGRPPGTYDEGQMTDSDLPTAKGLRYNPVDGRLYVVLGVTAQIKVIDPKTARVVATFGGVGTTPSKFQGIGGLAFRKNGNILVLDHLTQLIKEFSPKFVYVGTHADMVDRTTVKLSGNLLSDIAFSESRQRIYATSTMGNRVYRYDVPPVASPPSAPAPTTPKPPTRLQSH